MTTEKQKDMTTKDALIFLRYVFIKNENISIRREGYIFDTVSFFINHDNKDPANWVHECSWYSVDADPEYTRYSATCGIPSKFTSSGIKYQHFPERSLFTRSLLDCLGHVGKSFFVPVPNTKLHLEIVSDDFLWTIVGLENDSVLIEDKNISKTVASADSSNRPILVDYLVENSPEVANMLDFVVNQNRQT